MCTQNRQNEFVDFEAGERLWVGNPSRADLHRTAEPTVGGFLLFCSLEKVWVSLTRCGSTLGSQTPQSPEIRLVDWGQALTPSSALILNAALLRDRVLPPLRVAIFSPEGRIE